MTGEGILVRDCMETKIHHVTPYVRPVEDMEEGHRALKKKLIEECGEVVFATSSAETLEELADVMEVVITLAVKLGFKPEELEAARRAKWEAKGGFNKGVMLCWRQPEGEE